MKSLPTFALFCLAAAPASADLLLSEVFYAYAGADDTYEWVEIVNTGTTAVDLTGYILAWGGTASDGVALFAPGANVLTDTPIDAVIYDSPNSNGLIDETGLPGAPDVDDAPAGSTIARVSPAGGWAILDVPSPRDENFSYDCGGVVPETGSSWGALKSQYR